MELFEKAASRNQEDGETEGRGMLVIHQGIKKILWYNKKDYYILGVKIYGKKNRITLSHKDEPNDGIM